jgi:hypothetical protein
MISHPGKYRAGAFEPFGLSAALFARSHPQQNYVDYHKCVNAKGEDFPPCQQFKRAYRSLCPSESSWRLIGSTAQCGRVVIDY